jgi:UDP-N-acetyl-D-glucosamine dehydrogenase
VKTGNGSAFRSAELSPATLGAADCVVLTTNHKLFDAAYIVEHAAMVVDLRNMVKEHSRKVYKL